VLHVILFDHLFSYRKIYHKPIRFVCKITDLCVNGRQMPNTAFNSRAFDFANLASEAVSELQVYKTVHADVPTGGIGATINIKTMRPLDNPGLVASVGVKGVMDTTADNLPRTFKGKSITPEISGIFSNTWLDGRFGASANFSYQERESGYSSAGSRWPTFVGGQSGGFGEYPLPGDADYGTFDIDNQPGPGVIYARSQNYDLNVNSVHRQRRNGQLALQFAPTDNLTATLDYLYAENRIQSKRTGLGAWINLWEPGFATFTNDGPVAAPITYGGYSPGTWDVGIGATRTSEITEMKSLGFNVEWQVTDNLDLAFDVHDSRADIRPDNPYGTSRTIGNVAWARGDTTFDYSGKFPILHFEYAPGFELGPEHMMATAGSFSRNLSHAEIQQWQASGTFRFADYQALDFGAAYTDVYNRTATSNITVPEYAGMLWPDGSLTTPDDYDDSIWYSDNIGRYFRSFPGHNDPRFTDRITVVGDFDALHRRVIEIKGDASLFTAPDNFTADRRIYEKSSSAWLQWRNTFDWVIPVNVAAGVRYEKTEITSPAMVAPPSTNIIWLANADFDFRLGTDMVPTTNTGEYNYWLPSLDIRADLRDNLILRGSYGKSIGRAAWQSLYGGLAVNTKVAIAGGTGSRGNPGLLPLESKNFDLSLEWYYGEGSYASVGYFRKNIKNFISNSSVFEQPYDLHTPVGGEFWSEAISVGGCNSSDPVCIGSYILLNHADDPSVTHTGYNPVLNQETGTIIARDSDPIVTFEITLPTNQRADKLDGFEVNLQHMFGNSGFGAAANYTKVDSGLTYDVSQLGTQSPMIGLSDTANLVLFYEKHGWQVRAAYNWRDKFLSNLVTSTTTIVVTNPEYTESYGQLDMNVTWEKNEHLSFFVEGINLTDETMRIHGRHVNMLVNAIQTGPRYMFGVRYKF